MTAKNINDWPGNQGSITNAIDLGEFAQHNVIFFRSRDKKWDEYNRVSARGARGPPTTPQRAYPEGRYESYGRER